MKRSVQAPTNSEARPQASCRRRSLVCWYSHSQKEPCHFLVQSCKSDHPWSWCCHCHILFDQFRIQLKGRRPLSGELRATRQLLTGWKDDDVIGGRGRPAEHLCETSSTCKHLHWISFLFSLVNANTSEKAILKVSDLPNPFPKDQVRWWTMRAGPCQWVALHIHLSWEEKIGRMKHSLLIASSLFFYDVTQICLDTNVSTISPVMIHTKISIHTVLKIFNVPN